MKSKREYPHQHGVSDELIFAYINPETSISNPKAEGSRMWMCELPAQCNVSAKSIVKLTTRKWPTNSN